MGVLREPPAVLRAVLGSTKNIGRAPAVTSVQLGSSSPARVPSCVRNAAQASTKTPGVPLAAKRATSIAPLAKYACTAGEAHQVNVPTALPVAASQLRATPAARIA